MKYYFYVLQSEADGNFYFGSTGNLENRIKRHNTGAVNSTKYRRPFKLIYFEAFKTRKEAVARELEMKRLRNKKHIEKLIGLHGGPIAQ